MTERRRSRSPSTRRPNVVEVVQLFMTKQEGESVAALNGNGHSIMPISWFVNKIPKKYIDDVFALSRVHTADGDVSYRDDGPAKGIWMLDFHRWVAQMIRDVDSSFTMEEKYGYGSQARAILVAVEKWVKEDTAPSRSPAWEFDVQASHGNPLGAHELVCVISPPFDPSKTTLEEYNDSFGKNIASKIAEARRMGGGCHSKGMRL